MSTVQGNLTQAYASNISNFHTRSIYKSIYDRYSEGTIIDLFEKTGRKEIAENTTYRWFERDWIAAKAEIASTSGTGAGAAVTITYAAGSHQQSGTLSPFTPGDVLMIHNANGSYKVLVQSKNTTTPNAHTITVDPVIDTEDVGTNIAAADIVVKIGTAFAEGTDQPDSIVTSPLQFSGQTQIFKKEAKITGSEATNKIEFTVHGKPYYYYELADSAYIDMKNDMEYTFLLGRQGTPVDANGNTVYTTAGMDQQIEDRGQIQNYTAVFDDMNYINDITKKLDLERGAKENMFLTGVDLNLNVDDLITDVMRNGAILYNQWGEGNAKQNAIDLGVDSFVKGGFTFHKMKLDALNHKNITASENGGNWPQVGYVVPMDKIKDEKNGTKMDCISIMYKANDVENRMFQHWKRGKEITNNDTIELEWLAEAGLRIAGANRFVKVTPA